MGKLAEMMKNQMMEDVHSRIRPGEQTEENKVFTSKGFGGFLPNNSEPGFDEMEKQRQQKMSSFFSIIQALLKMMD